MRYRPLSRLTLSIGASCRDGSWGNWDWHTSCDDEIEEWVHCDGPETGRVSGERPMAKQIQFNSLLVPTDFSDNAWSAFLAARDMVAPPDAEIVVMHVIDPAVVEQLAEFGSDDRETVRTARAPRLTQPGRDRTATPGPTAGSASGTRGRSTGPAHSSRPAR